MALFYGWAFGILCPDDDEKHGCLWERSESELESGDIGNDGSVDDGGLLTSCSMIAIGLGSLFISKLKYWV